MQSKKPRVNTGVSIPYASNVVFHNERSQAADRPSPADQPGMPGILRLLTQIHEAAAEEADLIGKLGVAVSPVLLHDESEVPGTSNNKAPAVSPLYDELHALLSKLDVHLAALRGLLARVNL